MHKKSTSSKKSNKSKKKGSIIKVELAQLQTAFIIYKLANDTYYTNSNSAEIELVFQQVLNKISSKFGKKTIKLDISQLIPLWSNDKQKLCTARNIYYNICKNQQFLQELESIFSILENKTKFIDLYKGLGLITFQSDITQCIACGANVKRSDRDFGTICIAYGSIEGCEVGISYQKKCQNKHCKSFYSYGQTEINGKILRNPLEDKEYFELSKYTYF